MRRLPGRCSTNISVALARLGATIRYHDLGEQVIQVGAVTVRTRYLNHTAVTLGYRIEADSVAVVYATDHEPHDRPIGPGGVPAQAAASPRRSATCWLLCQRRSGHPRLAVHAGGVSGQVGWGHSTIEYALDVAARRREPSAWRCFTTIRCAPTMRWMC